MIWKTRSIPYFFQNFDGFYPLFPPKNTHPLCISFLIKLLSPKNRGIPYFFQNFDSFIPIFFEKSTSRPLWSTEVDFQIVIQLISVLVCLQISCTTTKKSTSVLQNPGTAYKSSSLARLTMIPCIENSVRFSPPLCKNNEYNTYYILYYCI